MLFDPMTFRMNFCGVVHLVGGFRAAEHAKALFAVAADLAESCRDPIEGFIPSRFDELAVFANEWCRQSCARHTALSFVLRLSRKWNSSTMWNPSHQRSTRSIVHDLWPLRILWSLGMPIVR